MDIILAFLLDCVLGDPYNFPHPVKFIGKYIKFFENKVFKKVHSDKELKYKYGFILLVTTCLIVYGSTFVILFVAKSINIYLFYILNIILLWTSISPKCLANEAYKVYKELVNKNIDEARKKISYLVSRDTKELDFQSIAKATIETVFENTSDGIIAPLFFAAIGGTPLAMSYKAVSTLDSMVGYHNQKYEHFGFFSAKADDILNFIPARVSGLLIVVSSVFLNYDYKSSWEIFLRDRKNHKSPNSAHPEAAGAGALSIRLGGSTSYFGKVTNKPYIGNLIKEIEATDIIKSIKLMYTSTIIWILILVLI